MAPDAQPDQSFTVDPGVSAPEAARDGFTATPQAVLDARRAEQQPQAAEDARTAAQQTAAAVPTPTSADSGASFFETPPAACGDGAAVVGYAEQFVGCIPYVMVGRTPETGFSCDTFVEDVWTHFGKSMTGDVDAIATHVTVIAASDPRAGDLVYYPHQHIGIYDGAGGLIDAPKPGTTLSHRGVWGSPVYLRLN